jgi:hypothetical protein
MRPNNIIILYSTVGNEQLKGKFKTPPLAPLPTSPSLLSPYTSVTFPQTGVREGNGVREEKRDAREKDRKSKETKKATRSWQEKLEIITWKRKQREREPG